MLNVLFTPHYHSKTWGFLQFKGIIFMLARLLVLLVVIVAALLLMAGQFGLLRGKAPSNLGVTDGKLKPPSKTENSVSSQADLYPDHPMRAYAAIAPINFSGDAQVAWAKLVIAVKTLPRTTVVSDTGSYLYAQQTTLLLRFTDDVEFSLDAASNVIQVRSASRLGRKDFGVNRKRIEAIRAVFNAS
jgi:uncharacterized protein (DUF1499 family)